MSVEKQARIIVEREIERPVSLHDDGSSPGMYDLRVGYIEAPDIAIECVGAVDSIRTETWNVGPAKGPISTTLTGDWSVELRSSARVKRLSAQLPSILLECERRELVGFLAVDWPLKRIDSTLHSALDALGIESIHCFRTQGTGEVHLGMTGIGGGVDTSGKEVPNWILEFLRAPERADVLSKLLRSGARECHVFVPVSFGGAPWAVESYLGRSIEVLPQSAPDLPVPVDAVWITYGAAGVRWDGTHWQTFDAFVPPDAD